MRARLQALAERIAARDPIAAATLAARKRTGRHGIGSNVKAGRFNLVNVTYRKNGTSIVETIRANLTRDELIAALNSL